MSDANSNHSLPTQSKLAEDMLAFVSNLPAGTGLDWVKDRSFLYHFEAARLLLMREAILEAGISQNQTLRVLDFGYLHGLVPEFLHRFFPQAQFVVQDHPDSPNFRNPEYLALIRRRSYLTLQPQDIGDWSPPNEKFDVIVLGELIEHLDPTAVAKFLKALRVCVKPDGVLIITTPNAAGLYNSILTILGRDGVTAPPIPDSIMNYGHIHLWPPRVLAQTAEHFGWRARQISYFHGREAEAFERSAKHWGSLTHQIMIRTVKLVATKKPKLRGFYVASFKPDAGSGPIA